MQSIKKFKSSSSSSSSSVEVIGHNEDLITQIAVYLPVKSTLRFQSVSKQWNSLLTHPNLALSHKSKKSLLFFQRTLGKVVDLHPEPEYLYPEDNQIIDIADFSYLRIPSHESFFLENSCNGLLLVQSVQYKESLRKFDYSRRTFYVCNPSTRKHFKLPLPDIIATTSRDGLCSRLAFDPLVSPYYKVIFFKYKPDLDTRVCTFNIYIYSSETKSCRKLNQTFDGKDGRWFRTGEFFNGSICWHNYSFASYMTYYYFDIKQESVHVFPTPPIVPNIYTLRYFGVSRGHLNLIVVHRGQPVQGGLDVYELKEDYSSWVVKYKVDLQSIAVGFPEINKHFPENIEKETHYKYAFMCSLEEEGEEAPKLVVYVGADVLLAYNLIDKTSKKLCNIPDCRSGYIKVFQCIESLFGV